MDTRRVLDGLEAVTPWQEELYAHLHQNPELSMQEKETAAEVSRRLESFGYDVQQIGGVVGVLANGEGPTVLFRADMDALPVKEATGLPYASTRTAVDPQGVTVPVMHACGHDLHVVAALGAASLLAGHRDAWSGTYVALFQPAEETAAGARSMVDDGLVEKIPKPDVALAQHVMAVPAAGEVGTTAGPMMSTGACIRVKVYGEGTHGSMPHLGIDPVVLSAAIVTRLQTIVAREIAPSDLGVVTVGSLQAGTKANIIPDDATMLLNIRAYDLDVREKLLTAIERIVRAECEAAGSTRPPEIELYESFPLTDNDAPVNAKVTEAFVAHFGPDRVKRLDPLTGPRTSASSRTRSVSPTATGPSAASPPTSAPSPTTTPASGGDATHADHGHRGCGDGRAVVPPELRLRVHADNWVS
ncbi:amidohydrolase [Nocardioides seonyuensis]|uniref:amidohydrolase n=1 Tax=Nocardioides seonyuensis TaxID=2518371 RepID=UPI001FC9BE88|nr:amidohydrolase [Nocardioides seonyuensis]